MAFKFEYATDADGGNITLEALSYTHDVLALRGYLAYNPAVTTKLPGVLVIHDFWGPTSQFIQERAMQIAKLGYVGMVVDMYGVGHQLTREECYALMTPIRNDRSLMRSRIQAGYDLLRQHPRVDGERIAVMGFCFGGCVALELARSGAPIRAAISIHGSLDTPHPEDSKNIKAKILVLHGSEDPVVTQQHVSGLMEEMRAAEVDWQLTQYGSAKHGFTNPTSVPSPAAAYHPEADRRSRIAVKNFLEEVFA